MKTRGEVFRWCNYGKEHPTLPGGWLPFGAGVLYHISLSVDSIFIQTREIRR